MLYYEFKHIDKKLPVPEGVWAVILHQIINHAIIIYRIDDNTSHVWNRVGQKQITNMEFNNHSVKTS